MITLTTEQAQQIEEALVRLEQIDGMYSWADSLDVIRAARAQEQEPVARVTGYHGGRCVVEPLNRALVLPIDMALYAAQQPVSQEPIGVISSEVVDGCVKWLNGWVPREGSKLYTAPVQQVTRADLKAAFKEGFERAADLYAPKAEQEPSISDGLCGGCTKKSADGWALYCVECWEKGNGQSASNEPAANAHVSNADSDILSDVEQEPFAYEVWDENDQVLILIYASYLKEAPWLEEDDIIRKLYAAPVRTKDLTDDEAQKLWNDTSSIVPMWAHHLHFARAVIAADREKNK